MSVYKTMGLRRVVVTGVGMVTSMGLDVPTVWKQLLAGQSGITHLQNFDKEFFTKYKAPEDFPAIGGEIQDFDLKEILQGPQKESHQGRPETNQIYRPLHPVRPGRQPGGHQDSGSTWKTKTRSGPASSLPAAWAGWAPGKKGCRTLIAEGVRRVSPFLVPKMIPNLAAGNVSISFKAKGPNIALSTACAAGAHAIGMAYRSIQLGEAD